MKFKPLRYSTIIEAKSKSMDYSATFCILRDENEIITDLWADIDRIAAGLAEILYFQVIPEYNSMASIQVYMRNEPVYQFYKPVGDRTYSQLVHHLLRNRELIESFLELTVLPFEADD